jgi:hypothetical protein
MITIWEMMQVNENNLSKLPQLQDKLKGLQAAQWVDNRKWQMQIDLVELEIERIVRGSAPTEQDPV